MTPLLTFQALLRAMKMVLPSNNPIVRIQNEPSIAPSRMLTSNPSPFWVDNIMLIYTSDRSFDDKNMLLTIDFCCYTWTAFVNRRFHGKGHSISRYALVLDHRNRHSNSTYVQLLSIFMHPISSLWHPIFILLFSTDFFIHTRNKIYWLLFTLFTLIQQWLSSNSPESNLIIFLSRQAAQKKPPNS